jgi:hypothetical protein
MSWSPGDLPTRIGRPGSTQNFPALEPADDPRRSRQMSPAIRVKCATALTKCAARLARRQRTGPGHLRIRDAKLDEARRFDEHGCFLPLDPGAAIGRLAGGAAIQADPSYSASVHAGGGSVAALWRYPVKSMLGEELNAAADPV